MRVAALYDIHGNLPALEAVLREVQAEGIDCIVVGGDVVPGPLPSECLDALAACPLPKEFLYGNGEREVLASLAGKESETLPDTVRQAIRWTGNQLTSEQLQGIREWPPTVLRSVQALGDVLFCHATPRDDSEIFTRDTPEAVLQPVFDVGVHTVLCGHTHMQFDRKIGATRVVNVGSVGMPFGAAGADWAVLGPDVELRHTEYDLVAAAARLRNSEYPDAEEFATTNVLNPPTEAAMIQAFEAAAIGA